MFSGIKVGDKVQRHMAGMAFMALKVTKVDDKLIHCGPYTFDRKTGAEVDEDLNWGPSYGVTGSYVVMPGSKENPNIVLDKR